MLIKQYPDKILDSESYNVFPNLSHEEIMSLIKDMRRACWDVGGFGISAVQIGKLYRIFGFVKSGKYDLEWMCDPEIVSASGRAIFNEGCLSIPGYFWEISRPNKITVQYKNIHGYKKLKTFKDIDARVIQHEMDHLDGILIPDLMSQKDREDFEQHIQSGKTVYEYIAPSIYVK